MLIIDGYMGKSRKLADILIEKNTSKNDILILDSVGVDGLESYGLSYKVPEDSFEAKLKMSTEFLNKMLIQFPNVKIVVFEFNVHRKVIPSFSILEKKYGKEFILTVQCPAEESQNDIKIYEV